MVKSKAIILNNLNFSITAQNDKKKYEYKFEKGNGKCVKATHMNIFTIQKPAY